MAHDSEIDPDKVRALRDLMRYGNVAQAHWDVTPLVIDLCNEFFADECRLENLEGLADHVMDADLVDKALDLAEDLKGSEALVAELKGVQETLIHSSDEAAKILA